MQWMVKDVAALLDVPERVVHQWVARREIPSHRIGDAIRFSRDELIEWASARGLDIARLVGTPAGADVTDLALALRSGGIHHGVRGDTRSEVLRAMVSLLSISDDDDRASLLAMLLAREQLASTGVGDGIAIPHVRSPIVLDVEAPIVVLGLLEHPVDFGAIDHQLVQSVFLLVTPSVRAHLHLLSGLAHALQSSAVRESIRRAAPAGEILALLDHLD
jgi:nitrogen PTS system EIIA component